MIHLCGKGNLDSTLIQEGYCQYEYISKELKDLFAAADIVLSRAGANAICELLALKKPNILVPLSAAVSRGDQILNAESFRKQGFSYVLQEEKMDEDRLMEAIIKLMNIVLNMLMQCPILIIQRVDIVLDLIKQLATD